MSNPFLPTIRLRNVGAIALLLLTGCSAVAPSMRGLITANTLVAVDGGTATAEQLANCSDFVRRVFDVPAADVSTEAASPDTEGNAVINWQTSAASGFCRVDASNNIIQFEVGQGGGSSPSPTPTPSPSLTPPSPSPTSTLSPSPTPTPSPSPFNPQSLVGLDRSQAIAIAQANGYSIFDTSDPSRAYMSNNEQQIILNIDPSSNKVSSVTIVRTPISPAPTTTPTPDGSNLINAQLENCKNYVSTQFPNVPYAGINVYAVPPDSQGNAIINWQTSEGAAGFCRTDPSNTIVEFVINQDGNPVQIQSPRPTDPVNSLW